MIQRIQSVYLLLGGIALLGIIPVRSALGTFTPTWALPAGLALAGLAALLAIVSIFLYNNRPQQRTLVLGAQLLTIVVVLAVFAGVYFVIGFESIPAETGPILLMVLPVLAYLFLFLARKAIEKDIALVRSMDRLR